MIPKLQLIHFETCNICAQNNTQFACDGSNSTFRVLFNEPIEIEPNTDYILAATLKGPDSYYGTKGMRTITHDNQINGNKVTFQFQYASGNNNGSSVEDGQLPEIIFVYNTN
jgi:BTB/POZ domain-containing protein 1/2